MAKQIGEIKITGTIDDITFYKMDGEYYARMKSSLTGKKFWNNKAFEGSRKSCGRFAEGNKLASKVYKEIEEEKREYTLYCFLKKRAIQLLKEGKSAKEAEEILKDYLVEFGVIARKKQIGMAVNSYCKQEQSHKILQEVCFISLFKWTFVAKEPARDCLWPFT